MSTLHLTALKSAIDQLLALGTLKAYFMDPSFTPNAETHQYYWRGSWLTNGQVDPS